MSAYMQTHAQNHLLPAPTEIDLRYSARDEEATQMAQAITGICCTVPASSHHFQYLLRGGMLAWAV